MSHEASGASSLFLLSELIGLSLLLCSGCLRAGFTTPDAGPGDGSTQDARAEASADAPGALAIFHNTEMSAGYLQLKRWTAAERELPHNAAVTEYFDARDNVLLLHLNGSGAIADGTRVFPDHSGVNHRATAHNSDGNGLSFIEGQLRDAVQLDGLDDRIAIDDHNDLDLVDIPWTIALWVKVDTRGDMAETLLVDHGGAPPAAGNGWAFGLTDKGRLLLAVNGVSIKSRDKSVQPGLWHHLSVTFDHGAGTFYVNGARVDDYEGLASSVGRADVPVYLGEQLAGALDEVAVWQRVLTADEISTLYLRQQDAFGRGQPGTATSALIQPATDDGPTVLTWTPAAPYGKELPDNGVSESAYGEGNASMTDIVGLWHFNGTPGAIADQTILVDASGHHNDGQAVNPNGEGLHFAPGRFAEAVCLDGVDDYIELPSTLTAGITDFTFSAWVLWRGPIRPSTQEWQRIFDFGDGPATNSSGKYLYLAPATGQWNDTDRPVLAASVAGYTNGSSLRATRVILPGAWHQLAITLEGQVVSFYIDGALEGRKSDFQISPSDIGAIEHWLGRSHYAADAALWACLDEAALWRRALSAAEVLALYRRGALQVGVQLRFCEVEHACDSSPFLGPDETPESFFEEQGNAAPGLPTFTLPDTLPGKFAQYQLVLSSFDSRISPRVADLTVGPLP